MKSKFKGGVKMKNIEIAQMLQISPATVSLALNNRPGVSEETKKKIIELRDSMMQSDIDSRAKNKDLGAIGLLVFKNKSEVISETPFFVQTIDYVSSEIESCGYQFSIIYSSAEELTSMVESINPLELKGLVVMGTEMTSEEVRFFQKHLEMPFVIVDAYFPDCDVDTVLMDNFAGITKSMNYAYDMGHRRIGFISTDKQCNNFRDRRSAFRMNVDMLGLDENECPIFKLPLGTDEAKLKMAQYIRNGAVLPTVLVADNDRTAMGAMEALKDAGYKVPEQVSIIGFDDMPLVQYLTPSLTSISLNQDRIAWMAVHRLIDKLTVPSERTKSVQQFVNVGLTIRKSVQEMK